MLGFYFGGIVKRRAFCTILLLLFAMSIALEFFQGAGGLRHFDLIDMVFNGTGLVLGAALCLVGFGGWCRVIERWVLA